MFGRVPLNTVIALSNRGYSKERSIHLPYSINYFRLLEAREAVVKAFRKKKIIQYKETCFLKYFCTAKILNSRHKFTIRWIVHNSKKISVKFLYTVYRKIILCDLVVFQSLSSLL